MNTIKQADFITSIADALQFISYYHGEDFIKAAQNIGITLTYENSEDFKKTLTTSRDGTKRYIGLMK